MEPRPPSKNLFYPSLEALVPAVNEHGIIGEEYTVVSKTLQERWTSKSFLTHSKAAISSKSSKKSIASDAHQFTH